MDKKNIKTSNESYLEKRFNQLRKQGYKCESSGWVLANKRWEFTMYKP